MYQAAELQLYTIHWPLNIYSNYRDSIIHRSENLLIKAPRPNRSNTSLITWYCQTRTSTRYCPYSWSSQIVSYYCTKTVNFLIFIRRLSPDCRYSSYIDPLDILELSYIVNIIHISTKLRLRSRWKIDLLYVSDYYLI